MDVFTFSTKTEKELILSAPFKDVIDRILVFSGGPSGLQDALLRLKPFLSDSLYEGMPGRDTRFLAAAAAAANLGGYDIVEVSYTRCASIRNLLGASQVKVLFTHDLDSVDLARRAGILGISPPFTLAEEVERMKGFDLVTVVGPMDYSYVSAVDPTLPVVEVPSFTVANPPAGLPPGVVSCSGPPRALYVASGADFNQIALRWLLTHVWPEVVKRVPSAELLVIGELGSAASQEGESLGGSVRFLGVVDDLRPWVDQCCVSVAPYYIGDGVKLKVLEALALGLPVVTTSLGITNTRLQPGRHLLLADTAKDFAAAIIDLVSNPAARAQLAADGQTFVARNYEFRTACKAYQDRILSLLESQKPPLRLPTASSSSSTAPEWVEQGLAIRVPFIISVCRRAGFKKLAVFGAGGHTRTLLPLWEANCGPEVVSILISAHDGPSSFLGRPVYNISELPPDSVDAILLSSHKHEQEMAKSCHRHFPDLPVVHIWASQRLADESLFADYNSDSALDPISPGSQSFDQFFALHHILKELPDTIPSSPLPSLRGSSPGPSSRIPAQLTRSGAPVPVTSPIISLGFSLFSLFESLRETVFAHSGSSFPPSDLWTLFSFLNHARHIPGEIWICGTFPPDVAIFFLESAQALALQRVVRVILTSPRFSNNNTPESQDTVLKQLDSIPSALSKYSFARFTTGSIPEVLAPLQAKLAAFVYLVLTDAKTLTSTLEIVLSTQGTGSIILIRRPAALQNWETDLTIDQFARSHSLAPIFLSRGHILFIYPGLNHAT